MANGNVFVEAFTNVLGGAYVPVASKQSLEDALKETSRVLALYMDGDELKVSEDWLSDQIVDFGDWLLEHLPDYSEDYLCQDYGKFPVIGKYGVYSALERVSMLEDYLSEENQPEEEHEMVAYALADAICSTTSAFSVSYSVDEETDTFYVPACSPEDVLGFQDVLGGGEEEIELTPRSLAWVQCHHAILACTVGGIGTLTVCQHDGDVLGIWSTAFVGGRAWPVEGSAVAEILSFVAEGGGAALAERWMGFEPTCDFEGAAMMTAQALASSIVNSLPSAEGLSAHGEGKSFQLRTTGPVIVSGDFNGQLEPHSLDVELMGEDLSDLFDDVLSLDPFMTGETASQCVTVAALTRAASCLLAHGTIEPVAEQVKDFAMFKELDTNDRPFDEQMLAMVSGYDEHMHEEMLYQTMTDFYETAPADSKREIDAVVDTMQDNSSSRFMITFDGEIGEGDSNTLKAKSAFIPAGLAPSNEEEARKRLRSMCTQCMLSSNTTMLLARRPSGPSPISISVVGWSGGHWSDMGADQALEFFDTTNIGEFLEMAPGETFDYQEIKHPNVG